MNIVIDVKYCNAGMTQGENTNHFVYNSSRSIILFVTRLNIKCI